MIVLSCCLVSLSIIRRVDEDTCLCFYLRMCLTRRTRPVLFSLLFLHSAYSRTSWICWNTERLTAKEPRLCVWIYLGVNTLFIFEYIPVCLLVHVAAVWFCDCVYLFVWIYLFIFFGVYVCVCVVEVVCVCVCVVHSSGWTPECPQWQRGMAGCPNQQPTANSECSQFSWLSVLSH